MQSFIYGDPKSPLGESRLIYEHAEDEGDALNIIGGLSEPVDLLLTELVMPRMDGMKLEEEIRKIYPQIHVIYTSGYTHDAIVQRGQIGTDRHFLAKPYSPGTLLEYIC